LKEKANRLANENNTNDFKASNGFISRFKDRNAIIFHTFHGESDRVPDLLCNEWINSKILQLTQHFSPKDISNGDEFGLFWRILSNKLYTLKGKKVNDGKNSKERISVFVGSNMNGSEKLKFLMIGRAKQPLCFRGKQSIPIIY
jgi:hypothetical protein